MLKRTRVFFQIILLILLLYLLTKAKINLEKILPRLQPPEVKTAQITQGKEEEFIREDITYVVKLGKINLGRAKFSHIENIRINNRLVKVIKFETRLPRFTDTELIYSDAQTMLPVEIKRSIVQWFVKEEITEEYNQTDYTLRITKKARGKQESLVIKKDAPIHNAILLPHYVRNIPRLEIGGILRANLPNRQYDIKLAAVQQIKVPAGVFKAYYFKSIPKQIEIWLSADQLRIPVKIQGANKFGYSLVLKEYSSHIEKAAKNAD